LIYAAEPATSPLRMKCYECSAEPGTRCAGKADTFHDVRRDDFYSLIEIERKMNDWKKSYGKGRA
jgi:hypothetical protein